MPNNPKHPFLSRHETATLRVIDASINRATEGLRVVEDFVRFVQDDGLLARLIKTARHDLVRLVSGQATLSGLPRGQVPKEEESVCWTAQKDSIGNGLDAPWTAIGLHGARETARDVGTQITTTTETCRGTPLSVCAASFQRVKQALRSLEEYSKLTSPQRSAAVETLRYRIYTLERCITLAAVSREQLKAAQLCVLTDGGEDPQSFTTLVTELAMAGVGMIQLRDKQLGDAALAARARLLVELTRLSPQAMQQNGGQQMGQALAIINDRPDIAAVAHADGVHLGQEDLPVKDARMIVGPRALVGVSIHSIEQARTAVLDGANYLGVGPTFPSTTKAFAAYPGLELLDQVAEEISLPAYAIGGINAENLGDVLATGIDHMAVSGAVLQASQPAMEASRLLEIIDEYG